MVANVVSSASVVVVAYNGRTRELDVTCSSFAMQRALAVASLHSPHSLAIGDDDKLVSLTGHDDSNPRRLRLFHSLTVHASLLMSMTQGHRHSASTSQNIKASLANAYQELGKELCSTKVKVIGNYTLGRVIGEGERKILYDSGYGLKSSQEPMVRSDSARTD